MREIELYEIFKFKCPVCGARNKVYTELLDYHCKFVGYSLKCCKCGAYKEFFLDYYNNGKIHPDYHSGEQYCMMLQFCNWKDCKIRGKKLRRPPHDDGADRRNTDYSKNKCKFCDGTLCSYCNQTIDYASHGNLEVHIVHNEQFL